MRVRTLIADDEPRARDGLARSLGDVPWIDVVAVARNGPEAVTFINDLRPELVFLDIGMPGLLGTDVLRQVVHRPYVVFVTAHAEYAVAAFELGALDYILKPFGPARLAALLRRVQLAMEAPASGDGFGRFREVFGRDPLRRLFVRRGDRIIPVEVDAVVWFEARGDFVAAHQANSRHLLRISLNHLERRLDPARFIRIHRSHVVNLTSVVAFRRAGNRALVAELDTGVRLPVSRGRAAAIRALRL